MPAAPTLVVHVLPRDHRCRNPAHRGSSELETYYAGKTQITDESLAILSGLTALQRLTFWETAGITSAGVAVLAGLPRLQELSLEGLPHVTADIVSAFPPHVHVSYAP